MRNIGPCAFCQEPAITCCEWPVDRYLLDSVDRVKVGDRVRRATERRGRPPAIVEFITPWFPSNTSPQDGYLVELKLPKRTRPAVMPYGHILQVLRSTPCGMPVCEDHLRCVEPGVEYCQDHWHSWSMVA